MKVIILNAIFLIAIHTSNMGQIFNYQDNVQSKGFWESVKIKPHSEASFFDVTGSGIVNKLWLTTFPTNEKEDMKLANSLVIKMYWDDSKTASVSVPVADFFCQSLKLQAIENHFFYSTNNQMLFTSTIPMPFRKGAQFELVNNSDKEVELFYGIDVEFRTLENEVMYLHTYWQRFDDLDPDKSIWLLPKVKGKGKYLGTHLSLFQKKVLENWPWYTRPITVNLDAKTENESPALYIKTLDDFFGSAWWDREQEHNSYTYQYIGRPLVELDESGNLAVVLYRYHVQDPLWFKESVSIEIGKNWNWGNQKIGNGSWTSTSFFYLYYPENK